MRRGKESSRKPKNKSRVSKADQPPQIQMHASSPSIPMRINTPLHLVYTSVLSHSSVFSPHYILCLPTSFPGRRAVVITPPKLTPPARYSTLLMFVPPSPPEYKCWAISGLTIPNSLPQKLAIPHAVPRIGAGNASGVQPYRTALNMD